MQELEGEIVSLGWTFLLVIGVQPKPQLNSHRSCKSSTSQQSINLKY
jgi:hypothetical protein